MSSMNSEQYIRSVERILQKASQHINEELLKVFCPGAQVEVDLSAKIKTSPSTVDTFSSSSGRITFSDSFRSSQPSPAKSEKSTKSGGSRAQKSGKKRQQKKEQQKQSGDRDSFNERVSYVRKNPRTPSGTQMLFDCRGTLKNKNRTDSGRSCNYENDDHGGSI